jgi:hypothetical protein
VRQSDSIASGPVTISLEQMPNSSSESTGRYSRPYGVRISTPVATPGNALMPIGQGGPRDRVCVRIGLAQFSDRLCPQSERESGVTDQKARAHKNPPTSGAHISTEGRMMRPCISPPNCMAARPIYCTALNADMADRRRPRRLLPQSASSTYPPHRSGKKGAADE